MMGFYSVKKKSSRLSITIQGTSVIREKKSGKATCCEQTNKCVES